MRRPTGRGARRVALSLLLALGLARCATSRPSPPTAAPIPPGQAVELTRQWAAEWESFTGMRAAIDLTVKSRRGTDRTAALLLVAPTALRLEVATPFGLPALVATAGPDEITVFRVLERRAETGRPSPAAVERWLGVAIPPTTLIRLLVGSVALPRDPAIISVDPVPSPHLTWTEDGVRQQVWVNAEGRPVRLLLDATASAREPLGAEFEWTPAGALAGVRLEAPGRGAEVMVRYLSAESVQSSPDAFRLVLPPGTPVQRLD